MKRGLPDLTRACDGACSRPYRTIYPESCDPPKWEIMRCLKRYIAREVYHVLLSSAPMKPPMLGTTGRAAEADIA